MTRLISILTILLLSSCMSDYNKREVTKYMTEIKELNQILIDQKALLIGQNDPEAISAKIPQTERLIHLLRTKLNLTQIEFHDKIKGSFGNLGIAYRFGNPEIEEYYSFLIFTQNKDHLELFKHYEQFSNCGKSVLIDENWAFSGITVDCNN